MARIAGYAFEPVLHFHYPKASQFAATQMGLACRKFDQ